MIGVFMTFSGFNWVAAMSGQDINTETAVQKEEKVEDSDSTLDEKQEEALEEKGEEINADLESEDAEKALYNVKSNVEQSSEKDKLSTIVNNSTYPQCLELWGASSGGSDPMVGFRARFNIIQSGSTFKLKKESAEYNPIHGALKGSYTIYVIPKEEFADGKIQDIYSKEKQELVTFSLDEYASAIDFSDLTDYTFEVGDRLCFSPYIDGIPTFSFTGEQLVQDGYRTPPTHTGSGTRVHKYYYWDDDPEGSIIALYEFTGSGIKEILNNPPEFNTFSSLYLQQGGADKGESDLIMMGIKATDDRDENGILPSTEQSIDFTQKVKYNFLSGGNGLGSSSFDANSPSSWSVQYSVKDAWGSQKTSARNVFVFPDLKSRKVVMDAFTYQDDGSIKIDVASGESIQENVNGRYVKFGDIDNNYVTKINTRSYDSQGGSLFDVIYGSDDKKFYVSSQGDAYLPDGGVISAEKIKQVEVAQDRSVTIDTSYTNHEKKEVSVKITSTGEVIYPWELYIDSLLFDDEKLGEIEIANYYFGDITNYLQAGQICELKLAFWNPVPVEIDEMTKTFKVENFSIDDKWMDVLSANGAGDAGTKGIEYHVPEKGNGKEILKEKWQFKALPNSGKYIVTCEVALPEDFSIDFMNYTGLPYVMFEAYMAEADGSEIEGARVGSSIAVASDPVIENKNILWPIENGNSLDSDYARKNMASARTYNDREWHSLADASTNNLEIMKEEYKLYDFTNSTWMNSSQNEFESLTDVQDGNPAIYSYGVTVKDTRRKDLAYDAEHPLKSTGTSLMFAASKVAANTDKTKALMANGEVPSITETKMSTYSSDEGIINYILDQVSFEAVQVNGDTTIKDLNIGKEVSTTIEGSQDFSRSNPKPGKYTLYVYLSGEDKDSGIDIPFEVKENTWSYDTPDRTEEDGASGYIVIPKSIELKAQEDNTIGAQEEVFFANYPNATGVKYGLSVDKTFKMEKTDDSGSRFIVTSSSKGGNDLEGKWYVGEITNKNGKINSLEINFTAGRETVDKEKGRWTGIVTFYFDRK